MIEYIYSMIYTVIYISLLNLFVGIFVPKKNMNTRIYIGIQVLLVIGNYGISYFFMNQMAIKQVLIICINAITVNFLYVTKMRKSFALTILFQGCGIAIEYLVFVILQDSFGLKSEDILKTGMLNYIMGILCLMMIFCAISIIKKSLSRKLGYLLTEMEWLRFSVFPIFCIITIVALMFNFDVVESSRQGLILICIVSGLVVMNILVFELLSDALKRESKLADYKVIQERGKNETEKYQSMIKNYNEQQKLVHEFKNHMDCIASLIQHEEYSRLNSYISGIQRELNRHHDLMDTNNKLINTILNSKYIEAGEKNILLVVKANDLSDIVIDDQDMVILLSNLINNAIEACEKGVKKIIKLKLIKEPKWFIVSASNNYEQKPVKEEGKYITSKFQDANNHGIGIENIKDVIEKYEGTYSIKDENNIFQFSIIIPM